jgi:hypothetical protein
MCNFIKNFIFFTFFTITGYASIPNIELEKILICGVGKNVSHSFNTVYNGIQSLGSACKDYKVIIYENNSTDNTKEVYSLWAKFNPKILFLSEDLPQNYFEKIYPKKGNFIVEPIARARNIVLHEVLKPEYDDYKYVIMADLDEFEPWNIKAIIDSIQNPQEEWDAIFANGAYDLYALRSPQFCIGPEWVGFEAWKTLYNYYGVILSQTLKTGQWLKVESAFGGLGIYKREALKGCFYEPKLNPQLIKEIVQQDFSRDLLWPHLSPESKKFIVTQASILSQWIQEDCCLKSEILQNYPHFEVYICEHVNLHAQMRRKGFDKLYINPFLIHKSLYHYNY